VEWLFRRHFWIVQLAFLALAAIILAAATNMYVEHLLVTESASTEKRATSVLPLRLVDRDFDVINRRNIFQARREEPEAIDEKIGNCDEWWLADKSSSSLELAGTIIDKDPTRSIAMIKDTRQAQIGAKAYSINECSADERSDGQGFGKEPMASKSPEACSNLNGIGEIKNIQAECVYFYSQASRRCEYLNLFNAKCKLVGDEIPKPPPSVPTPSTPSADDELGKSIKSVGNNAFEIDRSDLDNILSNLNKLMTQAKVVPDFVDGKPAWRFTMIQPNSVISKLGFQVGDIITKINGYEPDFAKVGDLMAKLKTDSDFNVTSKRGSNTFTLEYNVKR